MTLPQSTQRGQWNEVEGTETNSHNYSPSMFDKAAKIHIQEKTTCLTSNTGKTGYPQAED